MRNTMFGDTAAALLRRVRRWRTFPASQSGARRSLFSKAERRSDVRVDLSRILEKLSRNASGIASVEPVASAPLAAGKPNCSARHRPVSDSPVTCYQNRGGAGNPVIRAFANSVRAPLYYAEDEVRARTGIAVVWGVLRGSDRVMRLAREAGHDFLYIDHAYFSRGHGLNYRITRNAYEAGRVRQCPDDRISRLPIAVQPWRKSGSSVLVCPPTEYFMEAHDCQGWLENTLRILKCSTDRPIIIRTKPKPGEAIEPLDAAFARTFAIVTHSSNIAVEAVVAGVPVFVSQASAAAPMGQTDVSLIEQPVYPERYHWLAHLGYSQFSFEEIGNGTAWKILQEWEARPFI